MVTPAARREATSYLRESYSVSERRACRALASDRSSARYRSRRKEPAELVEAVRRLAGEHPREGYRKQTKRLRDRGLQVNAKRVLRLRRLLGVEAERPNPRGRPTNSGAKVVRWATLLARGGERFRP
jgi:putative transposase